MQMQDNDQKNHHIDVILGYFDTIATSEVKILQRDIKLVHY